MYIIFTTFEKLSFGRHVSIFQDLMLFPLIVLYTLSTLASVLELLYSLSYLPF